MASKGPNPETTLNPAPRTFQPEIPWRSAEGCEDVGRLGPTSAVPPQTFTLSSPELTWNPRRGLLKYNCPSRMRLCGVPCYVGVWGWESLLHGGELHQHLASVREILLTSKDAPIWARMCGKKQTLRANASRNLGTACSNLSDQDTLYLTI